MRRYVGLLLLWLAVFYLTLTHPLFPGWVWGLLMAAVFGALYRRFPAPVLLLSSGLLVGWAAGAALADFTGLRSLKLIGIGIALLVLSGRLGWGEAVAYLGGGLVAAGVVAGLLEVGAAPWVAVLLVGLGVYLLLAEAEERGYRREDEAEARFRKAVAWRKRKAEALGLRVDEVLSDEELSRVARAKDEAELREILGPEREDWVEELAALLWEAQRVP